MSGVVEYVMYGIPSDRSVIDNATSVLSMVAAVGSAIAAGVSVFISNRAIRFSDRQTRLLETHNKLSVRPHLDDFVIIDEETNTYKYTITNNGTGPAVLKSVQIFIKDQLVTSPDPLVTAIEEIFELMPGYTPYKNKYGHESVGIGQYISPGRVIQVFTAPAIKHESCNDLKLRVNQFARMTIIYESIYGEVFEFNSST